MGEYAPSAIRDMFPIIDRAYDSAKFSGILSGGSYGYHVSRNRLRRMGKYGDYSIQASLDKQGDGDAGSGIDISLNDREMIIATRRLMDAGENRDPRVQGKMREFFGTLNGSTVTGYSPYRGRRVSADSSHLWHIHISIHRKYATDRAVCRGIAEVMAGINPGGSAPEEDTKDAGWWHVDPDKVSSFLWGLKGGTEKNIQAQPGRDINIDHWVETNRVWGVTDDDNWFAKEYLAKGRHGSEPTHDDDIEEFLMAADWKRHSTTQKQKLGKLGKWQYLYITDNNNISLAEGPARVTGHVAVLLHIAPGQSAYFRVVEDELGTKGDTRRRATYSDHVEVVGTGGSTYAKFPINVNAGGPKKGWAANYIRIQWHSSDPDCEITRAEVGRWAGR